MRKLKIEFHEIEQAIKHRFGISDFRKGQLEIIKDVFMNKNVIASIPTGSGKSLTYQSLACYSKSLVVVVEPFISLIRDQLAEAKKYQIPAATLHSDMTDEDKRSLKHSLDTKTLRLLFVTPERFSDEAFIELMSKASISRFVIDEAHSVVSMGQGFRPSYAALGTKIDEINAYKQSSGKKPASLLFLSATLTEQTIEGIKDSFHIDEIKTHVIHGQRSNIRIDVVNTFTNEKVTKAVELARRTTQYGAMLIYVTDKLTAKGLKERLALRDIDVRLFHASLDANEKASTLDWFKSSKNGVLVSTSALSAGFNKHDIRTVLHYNPPRSIEDYAQEIGRAGRDGEFSDAVVLYDQVIDDKLNLSMIRSSAPELNIIAAFAFFLSDKLRSGESALSVTADRMKMEYGLHSITTGIFRGLLTQARAAGALDFNEENGRFDIMLFSSLSHDKLLSLLNNHDNSHDRYTKLKGLLSLNGCKHDYMTQYFAGANYPIRENCSCCYEKAKKHSSVSPSELRTKLMALRTRFSKSIGVPAFLVIPSATVEKIISFQPKNIDELRNVSGLDDTRIQMMSKEILELLHAA